MENKRKLLPIIVGIEAVLLVSVMVFIVAYFNSETVKIKKQIELAQRYFLEEDYEQAIATFELIIEIDPKVEEAYLGLAEAYTASGDLEKALKILNRGYKRTESKELEEQINSMEKILATASEVVICGKSYPIATTTKLDISKEENVTAKDVENIGKLENLENLDISYTKITDISILKNCRKLEYLNIGGTSITNISILENCRKLKYLYMWETKVTDIGVLENFRKLEYLNIGGTSITDISILESCRNLEELEIGGTLITDISILENCPNLKYLYMWEVPIIDINVLKNCPDLEQLNIDGTLVTDISVLENCSNLKVLYIDSDLITDLSSVSHVESIIYK